MRASRLVSLLLLLQARGQLTARALAATLEVSERTIHRDVEALSAAGVPVYAERGPRGGIRLVDGYRTRLTGMTPEEAEAVFLSGVPGPAAELGLGTVVAAARLKVLAALPTELRGRATRLIERFHLDAAGWYQADEPVPHLARIAEAVWAGETMELAYHRGADRVVHRVVDPLGLVLKAGTWYLVANTAPAQDPEAAAQVPEAAAPVGAGGPSEPDTIATPGPAGPGGLRTYRVSRVVDARSTGRSFSRPAGFELGAYWIASSQAYERDTPRVTVTVRVRPEAVQLLADTVGSMAWAGREVVPADDEWLHLRLRLDWPDEVPGLLLRLVANAEVVSPPEVRASIARKAARIVELYSHPGTPPAR